MSYSYITFAQARQALAARLDDPANIYWTDAENKLYIQDALRCWQSLTRYWRDSFSFNTRALSSPANAFYDLTQQVGTLIPFTLKDTDLESILCYNLIEKQPIAGVWQGTDQFTIYDLTQALQRRRDQFLVETGMVLTRQLVSGITPASNGKVVLPDDMIDTRRSAWLDGSVTPNAWSVVWKSDEYRSQALNFNWFTSPGIPTGASVAVTPPVTLQLTPPPANPGELELLTVNAGAALDPTTGVLLGIPDDFAWVIRFGALADLLGQDGQARDPARAQYCEQRWQEGILAARAYTSVELAFINGSQVPVSSLFDLDTMQPGWQNSINAIQFVQTVADPLNGPDREPLNPAIWTTQPLDNISCQIANNCCEADTASLEGVNYINELLSSNQWASVDILNFIHDPDQDAEFDFRMCSDRDAGEAYEPFYDFSLLTNLAGTAYNVEISVFHDHIITELSNVDVPFASIPRGTEFKVAAYANPDGSVNLKIWIGGTEVLSAVDTVFKLTGQTIQIYVVDLSSPTDVQVTNFKAGNILSPPPPTVAALAGWNMLTLAPIPGDSGSSITLDIVRNAPVPVADGDFVQLGREELDAVLDYAQHLAAFKQGGAEFQATMKHYANFRRMALIRNERLAAAIRSAAQPIFDKGWREERQRPRRESELPVGIALDEALARTRGEG